MTGQTVDVAGHFGEWLQGRLGPDGPVVLVTLRCAALCVRVTGAGSESAVRLFDAKTLDRFAALLGIAPRWPELGYDMPPGGGAGASTATLVALARAAGFRGTDSALAAACVAVEGASDPLMMAGPDRLLWASREGRVVRTFAPPPVAEIVGGYWGAPVQTDPGDAVFPDISDLVVAWDKAVAARDLGCVARLASASAERTRALRGPDDPMAALASDLGALGHIRAHTGSARGLVFPPGSVPASALDAMREAGIKDGFIFRTGGT